MSDEITGWAGATLRRVRRRMGMIFQEFALVERLTVMENVLSGRLGYVRVLDELRAALSAERHRRKAFRYSRSRRTDRPCRQARRCAFRRPAPARRHRPRAACRSRRILLVDEPTASLDPKTSRQIMRLIGELCAERDLAAIVNIHDVALAQMFLQRIVGLRAGRDRLSTGPPRTHAGGADTIYGEEDWQADDPPRRG